MSMRLRNAALLAALGLLVLIPVAFACPTGERERHGDGASQGCMNTLPVDHSFKSNYAPSYDGRRTMSIKVTSQGSWIHHTKAEIYTFDGQLVAKSALYKRGFNRSKTLRMKLRYRSLQAGKYTLVLTGEPNHSRSCGPKKYEKVIEIYECPATLPVDFPNPPGGQAGNYGEWLSVNLRPRQGVMRNLVVELYDFDGNFFGRAKLRALYGTAKVDIKLRHKLVNGSYNLLVDADNALPRSCGDKQGKKVLTFGSKTNTDSGDSHDDGGSTTDDGFGGGGDDDSFSDEELYGDEEWADGGGDNDGTPARLY